MAKAIFIYGSETGNTESVAEQIAAGLKDENLVHIPHHSGHPFYSIPATDSIANWPPILLHSGHLSQMNSNAG